jgi:uncharacterized damage-inducible protein DinB
MNLIELSKQRAVHDMERFLRTFAHVPDDKLTWSPAPTAKSALRIAAHTALYLGRFAWMIRERRLPQPSDVQAWVAECEAQELAITDRQGVEEAFRSGIAEVLAALDTLSPEDLDLTLDSGQGWTTTMERLIALPAWHTTLHLGQIDYLQTCWGDLEVYVG